MKRFFTLIFFSLFIVSCTKNESFDLNPNVNASNDVVLSGTIIQNTFVLLLKARCDSNVMAGDPVMISNAMVQFDQDEKKFTFSFGHVLCPDSVMKTGVIHVVCTDDLLVPGTASVVSYEHYDEDGNYVKGRDSITTFSSGADGCTFIIRTMNGLVQKTYGTGTIEFKSVYQVNLNADKTFVSFSGDFNGISSQGHSFTSSVTDPLIFTPLCPWPVSGIITVNLPSAQVTTGYVDFIESDTCNDWMNYCINGLTIPVKKTNRSLQK